MSDLRWILLGIGLLIIVAIYLWDTFLQKSRNVPLTRRIINLQKNIVKKNKARSNYHEDEDEIGSKTLAEVKAFQENVQHSDKNTLDFFLETKMEEVSEAEIKLSSFALEPAFDSNTRLKPRDRIITLLIKADPDKAFSGVAVLKAAETVGLKFGKMKIFHHHGIAALETAEAIFSLASMYEPGYFDLDKIQGYQTKGLSLFMQLPAPIDNVSAFTLMQDAAMQLAVLLEGKIYSTKHKEIDAKAFQKILDEISI